MKTLFLATAAVAAFAAAPALAQTAPTGSVGVTWNNVEAKTDGGKFEADGYSVDGVVAGPLTGEWTVTLGVQGAWTDGDFDHSKTFSGEAHVTRTLADDMRVGGFIGAADAGKSSTLWTFGAEMQKYFDKATITAALTYGTVSNIDGDIWSGGVDAGYYVMPNLRVNGSVALSKVNLGQNDIDAYSYGAGAEYQINNSPMSVYGSWDRTTLDFVDVDVDTLSFGLRFNFGGDLQQRDRAGANLTRTVVSPTGVFALGL
jgi:hypothetical protein